MRRDRAFDWSALVPLFVHPTKVLAIEAMSWLNRPVSASELSELLDGRPSKGAFSYHLNKLAEAGAIRQVGSEQVRGAWKRLFIISPRLKK